MSSNIANHNSRTRLKSIPWIIISLTLASNFIIGSAYDKRNSAIIQSSDRDEPNRVAGELRSSSQSIPAASPNFEAAFQGECGKNKLARSNPCEHICLDLHDGTYECSCFYGFALAIDGYSCTKTSSTLDLSTSNSMVNSLEGPEASGKLMLSAQVGSSRLTTNSRINASTEDCLAPTPPEAMEILLSESESRQNPAGSRPIEVSLNFSQDSQWLAKTTPTNKTLQPPDLIELAESNATKSSPASGYAEASYDIVQMESNGSSQSNESSALPRAVESGSDWLISSQSNRLDSSNQAPSESLVQPSKFSKPANDKRKSTNSRADGKSASGTGTANSGASDNARGARHTNRYAALRGTQERAREGELKVSDSNKGDESRKEDKQDDRLGSSARLESMERREDEEDASEINEIWTHQKARQASTTETRARSRQSAQHRKRHRVSHDPDELGYQTYSPEIASAEIWRRKHKTSSNTKHSGSQLEITNSNSKTGIEGQQGRSNDGTAAGSVTKGNEQSSIGMDNVRASYDGSSQFQDESSRELDHLQAGELFSTERDGSGISEANMSHLLASIGVEERNEIGTRADSIRLIMMNNDKLVRILEDSISGQQDLDQEGDMRLQNDEPERNRTIEDLDTGADLDGELQSQMDIARNRNDQAAATKMNALDQLIGRSIEDHRLISSLVMESSMRRPTAELSESPNSMLAAKVEGTSEVEPNRSLVRSTSLPQDLQATDMPTKDRLSPESTTKHVEPSNGNEKSSSIALDGWDSEIVVSEIERSENDDRNYETPIRVHDVEDTTNLGSSKPAIEPSNECQELPELWFSGSSMESEFPFFENCDELPECEAGGKCMIERMRVPGDSKSSESKWKLMARCKCPIGRGGLLCQIPIQRSISRFGGHSYIALPVTADLTLSNMRILFKPESRVSEYPSKRLVLYSSGFILLLDEMNRVEMRYLNGLSNSREENSMQMIRVIGSRDAQLDAWNELLVTDDASGSQMNSFRSTASRIVLVIPNQIKISQNIENSIPTDAWIELTGENRNTTGDNIGATSDRGSPMEFFVAGIPKAKQVGRSVAISEESMFGKLTSMSGFVGCIKELSINDRVYRLKSDLMGDALDGFDLTECC